MHRSAWFRECIQSSVQPTDLGKRRDIWLFKLPPAQIVDGRSEAVPNDVTFSTNIALANRMIERVAFSVPEIRKLLLKLLWTAVPEEDKVLAWSACRRWHQHRARECHDRKRGARPPDRTTTTVGLRRLWVDPQFFIVCLKSFRERLGESSKLRVARLGGI